MLKGAEALALFLSGPRRVYIGPGSPFARALRLLLREPNAGPFRPVQAPSDAVALGLCLGGSLLRQEPGVALLGAGGLVGATFALRSLGLLSDLRAGAVLIDGEEGDPRAALWASAPMPLLEASGAEELYPFATLALALSEAGGLPVALRIAPRALKERADVRKGPSPAALTERPFCREEAPYLCEGAAAAYHGSRRQSLLSRIEPLLSPLLLRTGGSGQRGVLLAGHLGRRAQARAAGRGLPTLRLGFALPFPEAALRDFVSGLKEVLVLEEGAPFLLTGLQALVHRAGLGTRIIGAEAQKAHVAPRYNEAALEVELDRFAGPARGDGPAPAYDIGRLDRGLPALRPKLDAQGEATEEPWPLHLSRARRDLPQFLPGEGRLRVLTQLQSLGRPVLVTMAPGPAFAPALGRALCDVQPPRGCVAAVAGALSLSTAVEGGPVGRPLSVALFGDEAEAVSEMTGIIDNALSGRDVLHAILRDRLQESTASTASLVPVEAEQKDSLVPQLQAAGLEVLQVDLDDDDVLRRALDYLSQKSGARVILCTTDRAAESSLSS